MHTTPHGETLLQALTRVAVEVQRQHAIEAVLDAVGTGLKPLGFTVTVLEDLGAELIIRYLNVGPEEAKRAGIDVYPVGISFPIVAGSNYELLGAGEPQLFDQTTVDTESYFARNQPQSLGRAAELSSVLGFGKVVLAPLMANGRRWGVLCVSANDLRRDDLPSLSLFALQVGSALEVAHTIRRLEERNRELETVHAIASVRPTADVADLANKLIEQVGHATGSDAVALHLLDSELREYVLVGEPWGYRGNLVELLRRFPEAELTAGATAFPARDLPAGAEEIAQSGFGWLVMVPLSGEEGRLLGVLTLGRRADREYMPSQLRAAEILGVQVASLVERASLYAQAQRRVRQLSLLFDLVRSGATAREVRPLLERVAQLLIERLPADAAMVTIARNGQLEIELFRPRPGSSPNPMGPDGPFALDSTTISGRAALERRTIRALTHELGEKQRAAAERYGAKAVMCSPLIASSQLLGTVTVARTSGPAFTEEDGQLFENATAQVAVLMEHVRLFDDLQKSYDDLEQAQSVLVRHERLAALGELAAVMAHEVRNPLGVIFNSLASLKRFIKGDGDAQMLLGIVGEEADRLNRIVGDLLDFARPYEAEKKPIALGPIIASAVDAATQTIASHHVKVVVDVPDGLPHFVVDGHLIRQAMVNLVVNAIQAMPRGGTVTVRASSEQRRGQTWALIDVQDEGVGISADAAERIFQPFFTTKATGTGLGLAVVKRIVDAHHGDISVRSPDSGGTTFSIALPGSASDA